jgi:dihydropteroate synthase
MGVLNATPDSFYDGGLYHDAARAAARIDELCREGADLIDIGGESTRPGAPAIAAAEQLARIEPALRHAVARGLLVSVDTTHPAVARRALELGAQIVNDVSCLADAELAQVTARAQGVLILMHSRGPAASMKGFSEYPDDGYADVVDDVRREWRAARERALSAGMPQSDVFFDPGIGFGKNAAQSYALLASLARFRPEAPIVVGPSRKSFLAAVDGAPPAERLGGTVAACLGAAARGACILRVHDVRAVRQALSVTRVIERETRAEVAHAQ